MSTAEVIDYTEAEQDVWFPISKEWVLYAGTTSSY